MEEKKTLMFHEAIGALKEGKKIKLPEWTGYWYMEADKIMVLTGNGEILDTPWIDKYAERHDWIVTDGNLGFDFALRALKNKKKVCRKGWNGKGMWILAQFPDLYSKMTHPYFYIEYPEGHPAYPSGSRVPWIPSETDLFAEDWMLAN